MGLRRSAGKAYRAGVLGADLIAVHSVPARWPVADRASGGRVADVGDSFHCLLKEPCATGPIRRVNQQSAEAPPTARSRRRGGAQAIILHWRLRMSSKRAFARIRFALPAALTIGCLLIPKVERALRHAARATPPATSQGRTSRRLSRSSRSARTRAIILTSSTGSAVRRWTAAWRIQLTAIAREH